MPHVGHAVAQHACSRSASSCYLLFSSRMLSGRHKKGKATCTLFFSCGFACKQGGLHQSSGDIDLACDRMLQAGPKYRSIVERTLDSLEGNSGVAGAACGRWPAHYRCGTPPERVLWGPRQCCTTAQQLLVTNLAPPAPPPLLQVFSGGGLSQPRWFAGKEGPLSRYNQKLAEINQHRVRDGNLPEIQARRMFFDPKDDEVRPHLPPIAAQLVLKCLGRQHTLSSHTASFA